MSLNNLNSHLELNNLINILESPNSAINPPSSGMLNCTIKVTHIKKDKDDAYFSDSDMSKMVSEIIPVDQIYPPEQSPKSTNNAEPLLYKNGTAIVHSSVDTFDSPISQNANDPEISLNEEEEEEVTKNLSNKFKNISQNTDKPELPLNEEEEQSLTPNIGDIKQKVRKYCCKIL